MEDEGAEVEGCAAEGRAEPPEEAGAEASSASADSLATCHSLVDVSEGGAAPTLVAVSPTVSAPSGASRGQSTDLVGAAFQSFRTRAARFDPHQPPNADRRTLALEE